MEIDHIFIFSNNKGKEADKLIDFGLTEGSSRTHPGQGTTNRKFYFNNFFLEILWVINEEEIQNTTTAPTKLWERSQHAQNKYSPYGLGLENTQATDKLFKNSQIYQPNYFPEGMSVDMITNEKSPVLPWTFRLPYRDTKKTHEEPVSHINGIRVLTQVEFEIDTVIEQGNFKDFFIEFNKVSFKEGERLHLNLEFDHQAQGKEKEFPELGLTIKY